MATTRIFTFITEDKISYNCYDDDGAKRYRAVASHFAPYPHGWSAIGTGETKAAALEDLEEELKKIGVKIATSSVEGTGEGVLFRGVKQIIVGGPEFFIRGKEYYVKDGDGTMILRCDAVSSTGTALLCSKLDQFEVTDVVEIPGAPKPSPSGKRKAKEIADTVVLLSISILLGLTLGDSLGVTNNPTAVHFMEPMLALAAFFSYWTYKFNRDAI